MSLNRAFIIGNLGKTPDLRRTPSGQPVCDFTVATNDAYTDKSGEKRETTEWHNVVVWGRSAENCDTYLAKGSPVCVEGRLQTRSWDDKQTGKKQYKTEIVASRVHFLPGGPRKGQGSGPTGHGTGVGSASLPLRGAFPDQEAQEEARE